MILKNGFDEMTSLTAASSSPHALTVSFEVIDAVQRTLEKEGKKSPSTPMN